MPLHEITTATVRKAFLDFFAERGHTVVQSASLLPQGDPSLLFVNSGMVPFKECFKGLEKRPYVRATSCQKSLRVSGKHNDYEQIGQTPRHHTLFEMLGNFSLGDYFKKEAIQFAWEFITNTLGMPKDRLWVTIHQSDDEAEALWKSETDIPPQRIVRLGDETNLWMMGDTGPRGYSSEIFFYQGDNVADQSREDFMKDDGTYLEFWNLVFMQFNRDADGTVTPLPRPCIDTGSGLERLVAILQGVKSNFDTDILRGLIGRVEQICGKKYDGSSYDPKTLSGGAKNGSELSQWQIDVAMRVIADHARAIAFLIADGVIPGNEKEAYVLRRLIRRATVRGSELGIDSVFMGKIIEEVIARMGDVYPELKKNRAAIISATEHEEAGFRNTLAGGLRLLEDASAHLKAGGVISGDVVFKLHDTFGFPVDLSEDILKIRGIAIDRDGFERCMEAQRAQSRAAAQSTVAGTSDAKGAVFEGAITEFVGYNTYEASGKVVAVVPSGEHQYQLVLDRTPFYAEMGGQIGDSGSIVVKDLTFQVYDTQKSKSGHTVHLVECRGDVGDLGRFRGVSADATVDRERRAAIARHHSGTHLLGAALRKIIGTSAEQRGSLVGTDRLRFDFVSRAGLSESQIKEVQSLVNEQIQGNFEVVTEELSLDEAVRRGAVAVFGEKYGSSVRVVSMGPLSMELCGGTHVSRTGDIGFEMVVSEQGISAGVRRIEAVAGRSAVQEVLNRADELRGAAALLHSSERDVVTRVKALQQQLETVQREMKNRDKTLAELLSEGLVAQRGIVGKTSAVVAQVETPFDREGMVTLGEKVMRKIGSGVVALAQPESGLFLLLVGKDESAQFSAGTLVKEISSKIGGKGGGKPTMASLAELKGEQIVQALSYVREKLSLAA